MFLRDNDDYIVCASNGDGGDSANRAGLLALFGYEEDLPEYEAFYKTGVLVRHPRQYPWNNPKNFSRDQLIPFVAGLKTQGNIKLARRVFWSRAKCFFFAQNTERDVPGSTKYPYPHTFVNYEGQTETRKFDFADPLLPDAIWHLILCAELYPLYFFGLIGYPMLILAIISHCKLNKSDDEGQIISQCVVAGKPFVALYKWLKPDWKEALDRYWGGWRNMQEMANLIKEKL